jgi:hypothetical protein
MDLSELRSEVLQLVGAAVIYGGAGAAAALALFRFLSKRWLEEVFAKRLEAFRHEQAKELQHLRVQVESVLSGALKIQEREFEALPEMWLKLNKAFGLVYSLLFPLQQTPDLSRAPADELEEFLESTSLKESQRSRVREADPRERTELYREIAASHSQHDARVATSEFQNYLVSHGLFLPDAIKRDTDRLLILLKQSLSTISIATQAKNYKMLNEQYHKIEADGEPLHEALRVAIEARLRSHGSTKVIGA